MSPRSLILAGSLAGLSLAACSGMRVAAYERPDEGKGLPPPSSFEICKVTSNTRERLDANKNGRPETISVHALDGSEVCRNSDSNENGRFDTWDVIDKKGAVVKRARDTDENGQVDEVTLWPDPLRPECPVVFRDEDGDGIPEVVKVDVCNISKKKGGGQTMPPPASTGS
jgi:hypothetical protein